MAGSLGLPVPRRLCCHGGPSGTLHPGEGPAPCLPSQNVCPAWEFISSANNLFFFSQLKKLLFREVKGLL